MLNKSPNEIFKASKDFMLNGQEPTTSDDWYRLVNFWAYNISIGEVECCRIMGLLYDCPLPADTITKIAEHQINVKKRKGE